MGDAASSYDPISSQGIYNALLEGSEAAEAIVSWMAGKAGAFEAYGSAIAERFTGYLRVRNHLYRLEQRWPLAPFWARRSARYELRKHK